MSNNYNLAGKIPGLTVRVSKNICKSCGAKLVNGFPIKDNSHANSYRCIDWHIKQIMDNIKRKQK